MSGRGGGGGVGRGAPRGGGGGGFRRGPIGTNPSLRPQGNPDARLYVGNLDKRVSEGNVLKMCAQFEGLKRCEYVWHTQGPLRGQPRGFAFVEYDTPEQAAKAQEALNGKTVGGRPLVVHLAADKVHLKNEAPVEALMRDRLSSTGV